MSSNGKESHETQLTIDAVLALWGRDSMDLVARAMANAMTKVQSEHPVFAAEKERRHAADDTTYMMGEIVYVMVSCREILRLAFSTQERSSPLTRQQIAEQCSPENAEAAAQAAFDHVWENHPIYAAELTRRGADAEFDEEFMGGTQDLVFFTFLELLHGTFTT